MFTELRNIFFKKYTFHFNMNIDDFIYYLKQNTQSPSVDSRNKIAPLYHHDVLPAFEYNSAANSIQIFYPTNFNNNYTNTVKIYPVRFHAKLISTSEGLTLIGTFKTPKAVNILVSLIILICFLIGRNITNSIFSIALLAFVNLQYTSLDGIGSDYQKNRNLLDFLEKISSTS